jgi:hypothetical protein
MKKIIYLLSITFLLLQSCSSDSGNNEKTLKIGDQYQGGIIFYLSSNGENGLIASQRRFEAKWGCTGLKINGANGTDRGAGEQNTKDIVASCSESSIAAKLCADLVEGKYDDWYLPSRGELSLLHLQKNNIKRMLFGRENYWSSSQYSGTGAWYQHFGGTDGKVSPDVGRKESVYTVCPIRAF